ncbi:MAG: hypothetical protein LAP21_11240 [Acidobacteriia bacterium]|nr:hypothetical protein [Terriglobia bacterium]
MTRFAGVVLLSLLAFASAAFAQLPVPASSQFDITGFIQVATLGGAGSGAGVGAHQGGFITVNGHLITVPSETIVILPANALTWQELFAQAPAPYTGVATGMALADVPAPMTTYEAHVVGNRVLGGPGGADVYIAGLIWISQHALNSGQGFINCINYTTGEIRVGGPIGNCALGARVQLNDPAVGLTGTGRYGRAVTPDGRFTVDQDNPTIESITGFPMCIPRVDPAVASDPLCPQLQRPLVGNPAAACTAPTTVGVPCTSFTMLAPPVVPGTQLDPTVQAPFEVGDWVTFAGTLVQDLNPLTPTAGPWPGAANTYISAHTITNNVAIYTAGGTNPAYVTIEVSLIGTGGLTVIGANEAAIRTRFEGFTSDVAATPANQRLINLYGMDLVPLGSQPPAVPGAINDRYWGVIGVDPGPPTGAAKGRWRFRPPCLAFGSIPTKPVTQCVMNQPNTFLPPTREVRAVVGASQGGAFPAAFTAPITAASPTAANGIVWGQYHAPIGEYIFPEQLPGMAPIPENNFNTIPFLAQGGYTSSAGTLVGVLDPWPSNVAPPPVCVAAVANAGGPYTVASGGAVTLAGSATGDAPITFAWTPPALGTIAPLNAANAVYTAPVVAAQTVVPVTLSATNCGGASSSTTNVTISAPSAPTMNAVPPITVFSGAAGSFPISGSDPNVPALVPLTFTVTQAGAPALIGLTVTSGPNPPGTGATVTFTAPTLPLGQVTSVVITLTLTTTNSAGVASAPVTTTVTVNPLPDVIGIQSAEYRTGLRRLIINATSSVVSANVVLKLQPYVTTTGATYNPDPAAGGVGNVFTNNLNGTYTLTINGVPAPACGNPAGYATPCPTQPIDVKSNLNGDSGFVALTRIRQ